LRDIKLSNTIKEFALDLATDRKTILIADLYPLTV